MNLFDIKEMIPFTVRTSKAKLTGKNNAPGNEVG